MATKIKIPGINTYNGGKSGNGTYQTIINHIPPHDVFVSGYLGNCGVMRHKAPAVINMGVDKDPNIVKLWKSADLDKSYRIENMGFEDIYPFVIQFYHSRKVFIYLDPPYPFQVRSSKKRLYAFEFTDEDHGRMLEMIFDSPFMIAVSSYKNELYDKYLSDWKTITYPSMTRRGLVEETLYMNYELTGELHDYSYIGADYREREQLKLIKKRMVQKFRKMNPVLRNAILKEVKS